ncbi:MAG: hypothetical protein Q4D62_03810 [Planctomycetia bacterium]|nr:hypothetical protein [Planctomycetia bacterium]
MENRGKRFWGCVGLVVLSLVVAGCEKQPSAECGHEGCGHDHGESVTSVAPDAIAATNPATSEADAHAAAHVPPHKQFFAEFPGHKYALEVILDENSDNVTGLLGNAHFEPIAVAVETVDLQAMVDGTPKVFTLTKVATAEGEVLKYELADAALKTLLQSAEIKGVSAKFELEGTPFTAELKKF